MESIEFEIEKWKSRLDEKFRMFVGYYESDELKETARYFFELGKELNNKALTSKNTTMDKKLKFMWWAAILTAVVSAIVFVIVGLKAPVEAGMSQFGHWLKVFFGWVLVTAILEVFVYTLGQFAYHWADDNKDKYGNGWFLAGIKDDFAYIKEKVTWKKVLKYVLIYVGFFALCLAICGVGELLVP